jgi:hypothetical protein
LTGGIVSWPFWIEFVLLLAVMGIIVLAARRKRVRTVLLIACLVAGAFWLGMAL